MPDQVSRCHPATLGTTQRHPSAGKEAMKMQNGKFPFAVVTGVPIVTAPEELDITNAPDLRAALVEAAGHGYGTLVTDMTQTQFCDSSGIHTLLAAHKRALAAGGDLLLVIPGTPVLRVFAITGIDRIIPTFTSLDQALAHARAGGPDGRLRADDEPGLARPADAIAGHLGELQAAR